jgi:hypothetical protein
MDISIQEYRCRIGRYLPSLKIRKINVVSSYQESDRRFPNLPRRLCFLLIYSVFLTVGLSINSPLQNENKTVNFSSTLKPSSSMNPVMINQSSSYIKLSNFYARYTNGNRQARGIKIAHFNKGSGHLSTKKHEIENAIAGFHPHVFGISEANLFKSQDIQNVQIPDYNLHTCPTLGNPALGYSRIVVYTHKSLVCKLRPDLMSNECSSIWMQVGLPRQKQILVCQTYREWQLLHQQDTFSKSIEAQLSRWVHFLEQWERALDTGLEVIVLGDMNINHLDWALPSSRQSNQTKKLKTLIEELFQRIFPHSVSQCVTVPTRFMRGQPETGIDHFYTNRPDKLSQVQTQFCGGSDHKLIFATRHSKVIKKNARYVRKRCYKNFESSVFLSEVEKIKCWDIYQADNVDIAVQLFSDKLTEILDRLAPLKTIQTRTRYVPWLSKETKTLIEQRDLAQSSAARSRNQEDWNKFKKLRNQVTSRLRVEESSWQRSKLKDCSGKPSEQWQHILGWLDWKSTGSPTQLFHEGKMMNKPSEIADCQNSYFIDKVKKIRQDLPPQVSDPLSKLKFLMRSRTCSFQLKPVHPDTVEDILSSLKNSKSSGLDTIDTFSLKLAAPYILPAITHIVNLSIETQVFPTRWKTAKIIPLYKKEDPLSLYLVKFWRKPSSCRSFSTWIATS